MATAMEELVKMGKDRAEKRKKLRLKREADEAAAAEKAKAGGKPARRNPNEERYKTLLVASDEESANPSSAVLPRFWREAEKVHGKGVLFGRILRATAAAKKLFKDQSQEAPIRAIHDLYKDKATAKWLEAQLQKDLSAGNPTEGGYLIAEMLSNQITDILRARAIMTRLGSQTVDMPGGNLRIPRGVTGATSSYTEENTGVNASSPTLGDMKLSAKKLMTIVPISNDLLKSSALATDAFVRNDATRSMLARKERAAWKGTGDENEPRGLELYDNLTSVAIGGAITADNMVNFLIALMSANVEIDDMTQFGWAFPQQIYRDLLNLKATTNDYLLRMEMMQQKTLLGHPFAYTQNLRPTGSGTQACPMYFGDFSNWIEARQGTMEIDSSTEAAYKNTAGTLTSSYSNDQTVLRLIDRHDFGARLPQAIARSTDVTTNNDY